MNVCVEIHNGPLRAPPAFEAEGVGAVVCFEGIVRPIQDEEAIAALEYQVYSPMAERMLEALGRELLARYHLLAIAVEHSRGRVPVGACSFRLQIASRHRKEAIVAMEEFIDRVKQDVPIWKRTIATKAEGHHEHGSHRHSGRRNRGDLRTPGASRDITDPLG